MHIESMATPRFIHEASVSIRKDYRQWHSLACMLLWFSGVNRSAELWREDDVVKVIVILGRRGALVGR